MSKPEWGIFAGFVLCLAASYLIVKLAQWYAATEQTRWNNSDAGELAHLQRCQENNLKAMREEKDNG